MNDEVFPVVIGRLTALDRRVNAVEIRPPE